MTQSEKTRLLRILGNYVEEAREAMKIHSAYNSPREYWYQYSRAQSFSEVIAIIYRQPVTGQFCPCGNPLDDDPTRPEGICQECR